MPTSLVIQTSFLGDTVLTTPLIAALATRGPVDVVTTPAAAGILANNPHVRDLIAYDKRGVDRGLGGMFRLASRLRRARYDAVFLAQGSSRSAALAFTARIPRRVGFDTSAGRWLYTERVPHRSDWHHAQRLVSLAGGGAFGEPVRPQLYPGDADRAAVDALLRDVPRDGAPMLALAPGSVWATKRWPHFPALASHLAPLYRLVIVGSAGDTTVAAPMVGAAGAGRTVDATGRLTLLASAELIGRCVALVTNDSAPLHLASAMDVPTVALFGPTVPRFGFGPLATRHDIAEIALDCRPCDAHGPEVCPLGHWRCMRELETKRVVELVARVVTRPAAK